MCRFSSFVVDIYLLWVFKIIYIKYLCQLFVVVSYIFKFYVSIKICAPWDRIDLFISFGVRYLKDPVELPVCPVDLILKHREGVGMQQVVVVGYDLLPAGSIVVAEVNEIQL